MKNMTKWLSTGCFVAGLISLTSCSWFGKDEEAVKPTALTDVKDEINIKKLWSQGVGSGTDKFYFRLAPALSGDKVIAADSKGKIIAFHKTTGKEVWKQDIEMPISGGVGVGDGKVFVGTSDARVAALNEATGALEWTVSISSEVLASPVESDGVLVVRALDGRIYGLDAKSGKTKWLHDSSVPILTMRGNGNPVIERGGVIVGKDNGKLTTILLATGEVAWESEVAISRGRSELERMVDIDSAPIIAGDMVYVASLNGRVAGVNLADGKLLWAKDMSSHEGLTVDFSQVYVTDDKSQVWALANRSGTSIWKQEKLMYRSVTAPVRFGGYIVVGDVEGYLHWMSPDDGHFVARNRLDSDPILVPPLVGEDTLYVMDSDGELAAYQVDVK